MKNITQSDLDLLCINIFVNLYEVQSATTVSQKMQIPASKVSRSLRHARNVFGNELFIRKKHGLVPNEYASKIYPIAKEIIECSKSLQALQNKSTEFQEVDFKLTIPQSLRSDIFQNLHDSIKSAGKSITLTQVPWSESSIAQIAEGHIDIGISICDNISALETRYSNIRAVPLSMLNKVLLLTAEKHEIYEQEISLESIARYKFINSNICGSQNVIPLFQTYCEHIGVKLNKTAEAYSLDLLLDQIKNSDAITLLPYHESVSVDFERAGIHACELSKIETDRLYSTILPPTLALIYNTNNQNQNIYFMINSLINNINLANLELRQ